MVMADEPPAQFALGLLPIIGTEFRTPMQPPLRNTVITNELAAVE
jgi:hypothetical protein